MISTFPVLPHLKDLWVGLLLNHKPNYHQAKTILYHQLSKILFCFGRSSYNLNSYQVLNKSFNIKPIENYNMTFKLKAWMIYLIGVATIPPMYTMTIYYYYLVTDYTAFEFYLYTLGNVVLYGGIGLGIYYAIFQRFKKKEQGTK